MLIEHVYGVLIAPRGIVGTPRLDIADDLHLGVACFDGIVELDVALSIVVALLARIGLVVLVANLDILHVKGLGMSIGDTHTAILGFFVAIGILDGIECILYVLVNLVVRLESTVPYTYVYHVERLGTKVLGQLQVFVIAHTVGDGIVPVGIVVSRAFLERPYRAFPLIGTLFRHTLHETSTGEAYKLRVQGLEHLGKVLAASVSAVLICRGEERHHIQIQRAGHVSRHDKAGIVGIGLGGKGNGILLPRLANLALDGSLGIPHRAVLAL